VEPVDRAADGRFGGVTPRMLATATKALRDNGVKENPVTAVRVGVVGQFRRQMIAVMIGILGMTALTQVLGLRDASVMALLLSQFALAVVLIIVLSQVLIRTLRGDPLLGGARAALLVVTNTGVRLFPLSGTRRVGAVALTLELEDLAFAHIEPRRSIFDLPRFVFGHIGGAMAYEIAGKDVLALRHAIEHLEASADR
jgi:hypothetical protein